MGGISIFFPEKKCKTRKFFKNIQQKAKKNAFPPATEHQGRMFPFPRRSVFKYKKKVESYPGSKWKGSFFFGPSGLGPWTPEIKEGSRQ